MMASAAGRSAAVGAARSEDALVQDLAAAFAQGVPAPKQGEIRIGDDAAWSFVESGGQLLATDAAVEGVHADLALVSPADLGWKALMATVSDIAAMGGRPGHAVVAICASPSTPIDDLVAGVAQAAAAACCPIVGGDVSAGDQAVVVVTATGGLDPIGGGRGPVRRGGARPGDHVLVSGPTGGSAAGLRLLREGAASGTPPDADEVRVVRHRRPVARLVEGRTARGAGVTAMIDISDGLSLDLHRLAGASGVGIALDQVPVLDGATEAEALGGGEDYELVMTTPDVDRLLAAFAESGLVPPVRIGRCTDRADERSLRGAPLPISGWDHRLG